MNGGTKILMKPGSRKGQTRTVEAAVLQKAMDYPEGLAAGIHVTLEDGTWITVRQYEVEWSGRG